jgi:hypothetical protein
MTVNEFISKWRRAELTERAASQQHFLDLCELFEHPKPAEADPAGEWYAFERGAEKRGGGRGWADVWKRGYFGWEYKGKRKNLEEAYSQLLLYKDSLENPPLLVVCDMERFVVRTNFTSAVNRAYEIPLDGLGEPDNLEVLRSVFHNPERLRPRATVASVTTEVAERLGRVARALRGRGLAPTDVARFLDRIVFCLFAEDVGLLRRGLFTELLEKARDPGHFFRLVAQLFDAMRTGGDFGLETIRHFDGNLFTESPVLALTEGEIADVREAARLDWGAVDPSVFGTLFERGLDPDTRAQLGAQYTSREDIETLIEPVVMRPLRREWEEVRGEVERLLGEEKARLSGPVLTRRERQARQKALEKSAREPRALLRRFHERLTSLRVLDPACGSGNFLYVTLQKLKDLEKEVLVFAGDTGLGVFIPGVGPHQFHGIELNPYAFDLAQTTLWIGYLQWIHANGYGWPSEPILSGMSTFENRDAVLDLTDPARPREPEWPAVDFIVGNPPFLGGKRLRTELGDEYVDGLFQLYKGRVPAEADLVAYWFEKARKQLEEGKCKRAGLLATQGIRGGANREVLKRIKETGDIFFAESDRNWILDGATVHVSMVGFDDGTERERILDGNIVTTINPSLSSIVDLTVAKRLPEAKAMSFMGITPSGPFVISDEEALFILTRPNPDGRPNSDVLRPWVNGSDITGRYSGDWIIDLNECATDFDASLYEEPFSLVKNRVEVARKEYRTGGAHFWKFERPRPKMRKAIGKLPQYIARSMVGKHHFFIKLSSEKLPANLVIAFARSDDYFLGVLHSHAHEVWASAQGTQLREKESGSRYTPTTCFETFPFPRPTDEQREAIGEAARELDGLRVRWLNPPEYTREEVLEFPGTAEGPWARYLSDADERGAGTVRYPRLVPRDAASAAQLARRTLTNLYNQRPAWLEHAHRRLDAAVSAAYGFDPTLPDDEILARLLALNLERAST